MPLNSTRIDFIEARSRLGAKQAAKMKLKDDRERSSTSKRPTKKKSPSLVVQMLGRRLLRAESSDNFTESDKDGVDKIDDPHDSDSVRFAKKHQRTQEWLYAVQDRLNALDPHEAAEPDADSKASSSESEDALASGINNSSYTQEQEQRTQTKMKNIENTSREGWRNDVDSIASTLAEDGHPRRKSLKRFYYSTQKMLILPGVP